VLIAISFDVSGSIEEAMVQPDGLAVLGIFYSVSSSSFFLHLTSKLLLF
jgi:carbonic anhydrase